MVLQRFLCHKNHDKIGFLVTSLLSSPAETKIFEKEQKFLKVHGSDKEKVSDESQQNASHQKSENDQMQQFVNMLQVAQSFFQPARSVQSPPPVKNECNPFTKLCWSCTHFSPYAKSWICQLCPACHS